MGLLKITIPHIDYLLFLNGALENEDFISHLFSAQDNHRKIIAELNNYHSDEDGAPIVSSFEIVDVSYNDDQERGQVRFAYRVDYTFACADKRAATNNFETSNFNIQSDSESKFLNLFIHDKISRDTYEEF